MFAAYSTVNDDDDDVALQSSSLFPSYSGTSTDSHQIPPAPIVTSFTTLKNRQIDQKSDDNEISIIYDGSRKKHKKSDKKKKKKRKHDRKRSPPLSQSALIADKWSFVDARTTAIYEIAPFIIDRQAQWENFQYDSIYKRHIAQFNRTIQCCLGANETINQLLNLDKKSNKSDTIIRYFDRKVIKRFATLSTESSSTINQPIRKSTIIEEYIPIVRQQIFDDDGVSQLIWDASIDMYVPVNNTIAESSKVDDIQQSFVEADARTKGQIINRQLQSSSINDTDLWLKFIRLQDEIAISTRVNKNSNNDEKVNDRQLIERKLAIVDRAISFNTKCVQLKIERINIGHDIWDRDRLANEWKTIEFQHVNSIEMWSGYLSYAEQHLSSFSVNSQLALYDKCISKLETVLAGTLKTHPPEPNTEQFIVSVLIRRCAFLFATDYSEKAIACLQALIEFNFFYPNNINYSIIERRKIFEQFWLNGAPRIGDNGAIGWCETMKLIDTNQSTKPNESDDSTDYGRLEDEVCKRAVADNHNDGQLWTSIEQLRIEYQWKSPTNVSFDELEDPDRIALFDDVKSSLISIVDESNRLYLLYSIFDLLGVTTIPGYKSQYVANICEQFGTILPSLRIAYSNIDHFINRLFDAMQHVYNNSDQKFILASTQLIHIANRLQSNAMVRDKDKIRQFKSFAKELFGRCEANRNEIALYATYAEQLIQLDAISDARILAETTLARMNTSIWQQPMHARIAYLRLFTVLIDGQQRDDVERILTDLIINGRLSIVAGQSISAIDRIKARRLWMQKLDECNDDGDDWQGINQRSLCTPLAARFVYQLTERIDIIESIYHSALTAATNDELTLEHLTGSRLKLIADHIRLHPAAPPRMLRTYQREAVERFPSNVAFAKCLIDNSLRAHAITEMRRFFDHKQNTQVELVRSVAIVYLEFVRYLLLVRMFDDDNACSTLPEITRIRAVLLRCAERHRNTGAFWRLLMHIEAIRDRNADAVVGIFYRAVRECPWEKSIYIDCGRSKPERAQLLADLMVEKGLRLRTTIDECEVLREAAGGVKKSIVIDEEDDDDDDDDI